MIACIVVRFVWQARELAGSPRFRRSPLLLPNKCPPALKGYANEIKMDLYLVFRKT